MKSKKEVKEQINELQPLFEKAVTSYHYGGKGKNKRITFIHPVEENQSVIFDIYEQEKTDDPVNPVRNTLVASLPLFEYILEIGEVPSYLRPLARMGMKFMPGYNGDIKGISEQGGKDIFDLFKTEGIESATLFYNGSLQGFAKREGEKIPFDFIEKMNELIAQSV